MTTMTTMTTNPAKPETNIKPLGDYGVCLELNVSLPTFTRKDRNAGKQVARDNNANEKRIGVSKKLLDMPELRALESCKTEIYSIPKLFGTPMGTNENFIPNHNIINCKNKLDELLGEYDLLREAFIQAYPGGVQAAQLNAEGLGYMFDGAQYPNVDSLYSKIGARAYWRELPSNHPLESVHRKAQQELSEAFTENAERAQNTLMQGLWQRLREPLENMSKRLEYDDVGKPVNGHFKGTIVDNIMEIVDLMKYCNVSGDSKMEQVRIDLRNALSGVTPEGLKTNAGTRVRTKAEVDKIISGLDTLGF